MSTPSEKIAANRLAREKSPYLLQHAYNPVDWHPWGDEAFEKARTLNKPILLSIGYSTCHWCHVMERESFEDREVAGVMNAHFVNIKVDREELPEIDAIYMTAVQAMTGSGGWPMNVFLTPELKPFYGGTYFPPRPAHGRPSWRQLLERIHELWEQKPEDLADSANQLTDAIRKYATIEPEPTLLHPSCLEKCERHFESQFDPGRGGFGNAPKFPRPSVFNFLTRRYAATRNPAVLHMVTHTLRQMARGGIYDQLGGGFSRYSVDGEWLVPHFEKMLYDNAQLVVSFVEAFQLTGDGFYAGIARETLDYVVRDMTHPEGGFFSAEDADSEGVEGKFYVWSKAEIDSALGDDHAGIFNACFGVTGEGNFEEAGRGACILHQACSLPELARQFGKTESEVSRILESAVARLLAIRSQRVRPHLDDKILTSWNGLMISAFSRASQALDDPALARPALRAAEFIRDKLTDPKTGELRHRWRDGQSDNGAFQADYAFLIQGLLDLYETVFDPRWLRWALQLNEIHGRLFHDDCHGGFFMTPEKRRHVIVRVKEDHDNAEPSGNSIAAMNLLRLARLTADTELERTAESTLLLFADRLNRASYAVPQMAAAYALSLESPLQIVIAGDPDNPATRSLINQVHREFLPFKVLVVVSEKTRPALGGIHEFYSAVTPLQGRPAAYVCEGFACKTPVTSPSELAGLLRSARNRPGNSHAPGPITR